MIDCSINRGPFRFVPAEQGTARREQQEKACGLQCEGGSERRKCPCDGPYECPFRDEVYAKRNR